MICNKICVSQFLFCPYFIFCSPSFLTRATTLPNFQSCTPPPFFSSHAHLCTINLALPLSFSLFL
ncbi:hypothetical protein QBC42DRAFT_264182 [Cladorrhinum samala]|uniref:Uncharacterized protein n=1 Tax=Cladorrhinum samala TaxID=585594 RepID=A0AAV9HVD7_9PEZI|nr:hypothetical protein QBC42DRAFT_264182 [Cladorrhinum samala]